MVNYYNLKYLITEEFYENILTENYTIVKSGDRCLTDFYSRIEENKLEALIVYATVLSRVAKHDRNVLSNFDKEIKEMSSLISNEKILSDLNEEEKAELKEDIDYINSN